MKRFILLSLIFTGCSHPMPNVDATFWAGDSAKGGISRSQENKTIECHDPAFDAYACLSYVDVKKIYSTLLQCDSWGAPLATEKQQRKMINHNREVIKNVIQARSQTSDRP